MAILANDTSRGEARQALDDLMEAGAVTVEGKGGILVVRVVDDGREDQHG